MRKKADLQKYGIAHGSCMDKELIGRLCGCGLEAGKDKNQRSECGCMESIDIGAYDTVPMMPCYANQSGAAVAGEGRNIGGFSILCSEILPEDR